MFKKNLRVFVCPHVFENTRPILYVVHEDKEWQCLCGFDDHDDNGHLIGMGHILSRDPSIAELENLENGWEAERASPEQEWVRRKIVD